jgi:L-rhamnonate dehydratase
VTRDRIISVRAQLIPPADPSDEGDLLKKGGWLTAHIASPLSKYPEFAANRGSGINSALLGGIIVEVESESGAIGVASGGGGFAAAAIIEGHFARLIEGEKASAHGRIWDRMYSASLHYGRKGLAIHAISAVDLAIWDLHGKLLGEPVHELIGGKVRESSRMYATGPRSDLAEELGFVASKLPLPYGPPHGDDGFERNLETARKARAGISADFPLLYDCWMSLDVPYTLRLMDAIEPLGVRWVEEPLVPDDYAGFRRLAERGNRRVLITSGEHEYTVAGFRQLLETGACAIVQPDLQWCGGLTELLKISALAQGFGVPVVPHCGGMYAYHFTVTRSDIDLAEFPIVSPDGDRVVPIHAPYLVGEPAPEAGRFDPGDAPGFGLELDRSLPLVRPFDKENWPDPGAP